MSAKMMMKSTTDTSSLASFPTNSESFFHNQSKSGNHETVFMSNAYNLQLLEGFNALRSQVLLCDVTLISGSSRFPVHRALLAACSPYFKEMFTKDNHTEQISRNEGAKYTWFSESIELRGISSEGLKHIVEFMYTGKLPISMQSVQNILAVARHMQIKQVLDFCMEFLVSAVDVNTCVDIIHIAEVFNMTQLEEKAYNYLLDRFPEFMKSNQLQKLTFENMSHVLESNDLKVMSELDVFAATLKWIMYDHSRQVYIRKLMEKIRFPLMPPRDLMVHVNVVDFMRSKCNDLLLEASSYHMLPHSQPIVPSNRTMIRSNDQRLVVLGGADNTDEVSNQLKVFNRELTAYTLLPSMDNGVHSHCVAVLNNFLYVLGGQNHFEERGKTSVANVTRYDPRFNTWMKIASMNEHRAGFHVSAIPAYNRLYAVGGVNSVGRLSSVECYCVEEDRWKYVASTQNALCDHNGSVHRDKLYVSGGFSDGHFSDAMLCYNPKHDIWERRSPLQFPRGWHSQATIKDKIYVIGGNTGINKRVDVLETEVYSPDFDQWTTVTPISMGQSEAGACVLENKIYIVGGYCWSARRCIKVIQTYEPEKDEWERVGNLPRGLAGLRLCTLTLPHHLVR
ncbi:kelch-like protein 13 isoform X2 [Clavelina lepadiformis]|uniref:kelch-like protein 13 isoform X2 n=1 Tax=Clavelina lepadiformis TaxID=159417 RepID=UPI0040415E5F